MENRAIRHEVRLLLIHNPPVWEVEANARRGLVSFRAVILFAALKEWSQENLRSPGHLRYCEAVGCAAYLRRIARVRRVIAAIRAQ